MSRRANKMLALDFATQAHEMKAIGGQPDYALGSGPTPSPGTAPWSSPRASGSQLASYAWGAASVIFVAGAQKLVPTLPAAHERIYQRSLKLEDTRPQAAYGQHRSVGKILEIHQELPSRIHIGPHPPASRLLTGPGPISHQPAHTRTTHDAHWGAGA